MLNKEAGVANRATFVIDSGGKITYIEEGKTAIDPSRRHRSVQPVGAQTGTVAPLLKRLRPLEPWACFEVRRISRRQEQPADSLKLSCATWGARVHEQSC